MGKLGFTGRQQLNYGGASAIFSVILRSERVGWPADAGPLVLDHLCSEMAAKTNVRCNWQRFGYGLIFRFTWFYCKNVRVRGRAEPIGREIYATVCSNFHPKGTKTWLRFAIRWRFPKGELMHTIGVPPARSDRKRSTLSYVCECVWCFVSLASFFPNERTTAEGTLVAFVRSDRVCVGCRGCVRHLFDGR